jgi:hypothetical protein
MAPTPAASHLCGTWEPQWSLDGGRYVQLANGNGGLTLQWERGRSKKRRLAAERQREAITGQIGLVPNPKGC